MDWIKRVFYFLLVFMIAILASCSQMDKSEDGKKADQISGGRDAVGNSIAESATDNNDGGNGSVEGKHSDVTDRKVIRKAELRIRVDNFNKAQKSLETKTQKYGGYIVDSSVSRDGEEQVTGTVIIRIPAAQFENFLHEAEGEAAEVLERLVSGEDVTEQYVDLGSRLKSKKAVEARLMEFMKGAAETRDLLEISSDLAAVQEEIEQLTGKMNYLNNQVSMSTITVSMFETKLLVKGTSPKDLNTWERTKKQFHGSFNLLMGALSGLIVFFVGNLPIFAGLGALGLIIYFLARVVVKRRGKED